MSNLMRLAFRGYAASPAIFLTKPRKNVLDTLVSPLAYRPNRQNVFGLFAVLSFVAITLRYLMIHNALISTLQRSNEIVLITLYMGLIATGVVTFGQRSIAAIAAILCIEVAQVVGLFHSPILEKNFVMPGTLGLFMLLAPVSFELLKGVTLAKQGEWIRNITHFLLAFFLVECVTRFMFSPFILSRLTLDQYGDADLLDDGDSFYRFKFSLFFSDSNWAAIALLCLLALMLVYRRYIGVPQFVLGYLLLIATLSRSAIPAAFCQILLFVFWRRRRLLLTAMALIIPAATVALLGMYLASGGDSFKQLDGSFATKFMILERMLTVYRDADLTQKLFGIGEGNTQGLIDIAAHSHIATAVLEFGYIGSALVLIFITVMCRKSAPAFYLLVIPIVVNGFSFIAPSIPCFYVVLGVLSALQTQRREVLAPASVREAT